MPTDPQHRHNQLRPSLCTRACVTNYARRQTNQLPNCKPTTKCKQKRTTTTSSAASSATNGHAGKGSGGRLAVGTHPPLVAVHPKSTPPTIGSTFMLHVVSAASPLSLVIQPFNTSSELANLRAQMQLYYGKQVDVVSVKVHQAQITILIHNACASLTVEQHGQHRPALWLQTSILCREYCYFVCGS